MVNRKPIRQDKQHNNSRLVVCSLVNEWMECMQLTTEQLVAEDRVADVVGRFLLQDSRVVDVVLRVHVAGGAGIPGGWWLVVIVVVVVVIVIIVIAEAEIIIIIIVIIII